jgi:hypothetical protein
MASLILRRRVCHGREAIEWFSPGGSEVVRPPLRNRNNPGWQVVARLKMAGSVKLLAPSGATGEQARRSNDPLTV